ncbi:MAG: hypothetical protein Q8L34_05815 [Candidatus Woesearchaeota archaeon]|nr:hypothetical protein [Candidatus Woesearchaeota archaeon]
MGKDYLMELVKAKEAHKISEQREFKRGYHSVNQDPYRGIKWEREGDKGHIIEADSLLNRYIDHPHLKGQAIKVAHDLMNLSIKHKNLDLAVKAAEIYERVGVADKDSVKRRLLEAVKKSDYSSYRDNLKSVEEFLKKHNGRGEKLEHRVEETTAAITLSFGLVLAATFLSSQASISGYAVNAATLSSSGGWMGITSLLFILLGIASYFFRKK